MSSSPDDSTKDLVADALETEAPAHGFEAVARAEDAELVILHVIGYPETAKAAAELAHAGKRHAMLQYCLRSTQRPHTEVCGARPIVFDRPHYRDHYGRWAYYVEESSPAELEEELLELFRAEPDPVTEEELLAAREYFSWPRVTAGFWRTINREISR